MQDGVEHSTVLPIEIAGTFTCFFHLSKQIGASHMFCFLYRPSFKPTLIRITTGLDYHIVKEKENGNGVTVTHFRGGNWNECIQTPALVLKSG